MMQERIQQESAVVDGSRDQHGLNVFLLIGAITMFVIVLYLSSFVSLVGMWEDADYQHGAIVFPISAYLIWRLRASLAHIRLRPSLAGLASLIMLELLWVVGRATAIQGAEHLAVVLMIPASVVAFLGIELARRLMFPLLFLLAAVPVGNSLIPYLMQMTADVSAALLRMVNVPVFHNGAFLSLPNGNFEVAELCAGLRYLSSGAIIALLFSYLTYRKVWKRTLFVGATAVVMILANGLRAFVVMFVASATHMRVFAGRDHIVFGWLLFGAVVIALFRVGIRFADPPEATERESGTATASWRVTPLIAVLVIVMLACTARPFEGVIGSTWLLLIPAGIAVLWVLYRTYRPLPAASGGESRGSVPIRGVRAVFVASLSATVLVAGPALLSGETVLKAKTMHFGELPAVEGCGTAGTWVPTWHPRLKSPDAVASGTFGCPDGSVSVFVAGYANSTQGKELVTYDNQLIPVAWRQNMSADKTEFPTADGRRIKVNEMRIDGDGVAAVIWYWYVVQGKVTTSPYQVKFRQVLQLFEQGRVGGNLYLLETPLDKSLGVSRRRLTAVAAQLAAQRFLNPVSNGT